VLAVKVVATTVRSVVQPPVAPVAQQALAYMARIVYQYVRTVRLAARQFVLNVHTDVGHAHSKLTTVLPAQLGSSAETAASTVSSLLI
jgi:hypothetical protein